ncbi:MAG: hypothetical protein IKN12_04940 [Selenomonadaceae bacterium]|nr:hypothetical protein [Selenomonadaceae bacterium]
MQGYPKHLNTKEDYLFVKENFPKEMWKKDWQALLDSRQNWFFVKDLPYKLSGIEDETHKIVENTDMDGGENITYSQYELRDDENATIFRLGFTVAEVEAALSE